MLDPSVASTAYGVSSLVAAIREAMGASGSASSQWLLARARRPPLESRRTERRQQSTRTIQPLGSLFAVANHSPHQRLELRRQPYESRGSSTL